MDIELKEDADSGKYFHIFEDGSEAKLTFTNHDGHMIIGHVGVPVQHRNNGLAAQLVQQAVAGARARNMKVNPVCPYAAAQFRRHPEWSDLL